MYKEPAAIFLPIQLSQKGNIDLFDHAYEYKFNPIKWKEELFPSGFRLARKHSFPEDLIISSLVKWHGRGYSFPEVLISDYLKA